MESVNAMRGVLVAGAVIATIGAAAYGQWLAAALLVPALAAHAWLWWYLHRGGGMPPAP